MLKIEVKGYREAKAILDELPNNMQKRMLLAALKSSSKPMVTSAQAKVPVRSGTLRKMIKALSYRDSTASRSEVSVAVKPHFSTNKRTGTSNQYYFKFLHEGTKDPRTSRKGKVMVFTNSQGEKVFTRSTKRLKANPFLERAYSENISRTIEMFGDELAAAVEKFVNKNFKAVK
ncbi:MAG: HK97-gp10 family putative phage morphogenesis protein [Rikenellaceae bacterium]